MFRTAARYLTEPHPFARNPISVKPHAVDYSLYPKRIARTGGLYVDIFPKGTPILTNTQQRPPNGSARSRVASGRRSVRPQGRHVTI